MAKTTKSERKTFDALDDAAAAAKTAKKVAKHLPDEAADPVRAAAKKAVKASQPGKKAVRKHPKKVRAHALKATDRVQQATQAALAATEQKVHEDAAQEPTDTVVPVPAPPDELALLTVAELRSRARSQGRIGYTRLRKADLIEFLS